MHRLSGGAPAITGGAGPERTPTLRRFYYFQPLPPPSHFHVAHPHLAPDRASALAEILGRHTRMAVEQAQDNTKVLPNHVYIIPPNATLTINDTC